MTSNHSDDRRPPCLPWFLRTIAIILIGTPLLIVTWNILWLFIADPIHSWPRDEAARAAPMVEAIDAYRRDVGLWPQTIDDLVPQYLAAKDIVREPEWSYDWTAYNASITPDLRTNGPFHIRLVYRFGDDAGAGWQARCEGDPLRVEFPVIAQELLRPPDAAALQEQTLAELRRRMAREPDDPRHSEELERRTSLDAAGGQLPLPPAPAVR